MGSQYFSKPFRSFRGHIVIIVDLSNYATKTDLLKTNLASLKTEVDKLDIGKLTTVPADLSTLRDVVKNEAVKKLLIVN